MPLPSTLTSNRQWRRPQQGQKTPDSDPRRQQQPQSTGLLDRVGQTANTPLDFGGAPPIRDQSIIPPSTSPVNVPSAQQMSYGGQRVGAGPSFNMQAGPGVDPSQTQQFDPNSGAYFQAPNRDFAGQGDSLEQATFQRGLNRIDPYLQEQRSAMAQRLQNQGLPIGSEAYNQELNRFDRSRGDQWRIWPCRAWEQADKSRGDYSGRTSPRGSSTRGKRNGSLGSDWERPLSMQQSKGAVSGRT